MASHFQRALPDQTLAPDALIKIASCPRCSECPQCERDFESGELDAAPDPMQVAHLNELLPEDKFAPEEVIRIASCPVCKTEPDPDVVSVQEMVAPFVESRKTTPQQPPPPPPQLKDGAKILFAIDDKTDPAHPVMTVDVAITESANVSEMIQTHFWAVVDVSGSMRESIKVLRSGLKEMAKIIYSRRNAEHNREPEFKLSKFDHKYNDIRDVNVDTFEKQIENEIVQRGGTNFINPCDALLNWLQTEVKRLPTDCQHMVTVLFMTDGDGTLPKHEWYDRAADEIQSLGKDLKFVQAQFIGFGEPDVTFMNKFTDISFDPDDALREYIPKEDKKQFRSSLIACASEALEMKGSLRVKITPPGGGDPIDVLCPLTGNVGDEHGAKGHTNIQVTPEFVAQFRQQYQQSSIDVLPNLDFEPDQVNYVLEADEGLSEYKRIKIQYEAWFKALRFWMHDFLDEDGADHAEAHALFDQLGHLQQVATVKSLKWGGQDKACSRYFGEQANHMVKLCKRMMKKKKKYGPMLIDELQPRKTKKFEQVAMIKRSAVAFGERMTAAFSTA
jgi:hypothetical protein